METRYRVLYLLSGRTIPQISFDLKVSRQNVYYHLRSLQAEGLVEPTSLHTTALADELLSSLPQNTKPCLSLKQSRLAARSWLVVTSLPLPHTEAIQSFERWCHLLKKRLPSYPFKPSLPALLPDTQISTHAHRCAVCGMRHWLLHLRSTPPKRKSYICSSCVTMRNHTQLTRTSE